MSQCLGGGGGRLEGFSSDVFCPATLEGGSKPFLGAWAAAPGYGLVNVTACTGRGRKIGSTQYPMECKSRSGYVVVY